MYENARYYKDEDDTLLRTMGIGYHKVTGEHLIVMREVENGRVWCVPASEVNDRRIVDGEVVYKYRRCDVEGNELQYVNNSKYEPRDSEGYGERKGEYPGCTNDARCNPFKGVDSRNGRGSNYRRNYNTFR